MCESRGANVDVCWSKLMCAVIYWRRRRSGHMVLQDTLRGEDTFSRQIQDQGGVVLTRACSRIIPSHGPRKKPPSCWRWKKKLNGSGWNCKEPPTVGRPPGTEFTTKCGGHSVYYETCFTGARVQMLTQRETSRNSSLGSLKNMRIVMRREGKEWGGKEWGMWEERLRIIRGARKATQ